MVDRDQHRVRVQFVHDSIVADPKSVEPFGAVSFGRLTRKWITFKLFEAVKDAGDERLGQTVQVPLDGWLEMEAIRGHASAAASSCPQG